MFPQPMAGQLVMVLPLDCGIPGPFENLQHVGQGECLPCLPDHLQTITSNCHQSLSACSLALVLLGMSRLSKLASRNAVLLH